MRIVVAGAKGFIGRRLAAHLAAAGHAVAAFDAGDALPEGPQDAFVNLAWAGSRGAARADYALQLANVKTALDYYRAAVRLGCRRYVCPGTIGERMVELPECRGIHAQNFVYVNAKSALRRLLCAVEEPSCAVVWARLGNLYGGGEAANVLGYAASCVREGRRAAFGPAEQPYDFIEVSDAVRALAALTVSPAPIASEYYVGAGAPRPLADFLRRVGELVGRPDLIGIGERPDDGTRYRREWFSIASLTADTGFSPCVAFDDGVREMLRLMPAAKTGGA